MKDDQNKQDKPMYTFNLLKMYVYLLFLICINSNVRDVAIINWRTIMYMFVPKATCFIITNIVK